MKELRKINYRDYNDIIVLLPLGDNAIFIEGVDAEIFRLINKKVSKKIICEVLKEKYFKDEKISKKYIDSFLEEVKDLLHTGDNFNKDFYNACGVTNINDPLKPDISSFATDRFYDEFKKFIKEGQKVLDLGCNTGRFSFFCEENFKANVVGIDTSEVAIEYAKKAAKIKNSKCEFIVMNYNNLKFKNKFDTVIFPNNIIECSYLDFENLCKQIGKVLKDDGEFILSCPMAKDHDKFLNQKGKHEEIMDIPNYNGISYSSYFYSPGFINYILSKFFEVKYYKILEYKDRFNKDMKNYFFVVGR